MVEVVEILKNQHVNLVYKLMISASLLMTFPLFLYQKILRLYEHLMNSR